MNYKCDECEEVLGDMKVLSRVIYFLPGVRKAFSKDMTFKLKLEA